MSYLQIKIGPLKKDKEGVDIPDSDLRGLKFNQGTKMLLEDRTESWDKETCKSYGAHALIYAALKSNCIISEIPVDFTWADVCGWVDGLSDEVSYTILTKYNETINYKVDEPEPVELTDEKKNQQEVINTTVTESPAAD